ncbi:hypothetical protein F511_12197 [Dorcoceras hygrometricum]|uniref:Uncharacterized protein n=1 Tax=Dorcoceras hygrometricum TaxID=472368 RepID=A0A2Z7C0V8_9LAMI|nr:hypothetical protein F511_12197 [Dorcoceras hygrometricum]
MFSISAFLPLKPSSHVVVTSYRQLGPFCNVDHYHCSHLHNLPSHEFRFPLVSHTPASSHRWSISGTISSNEGTVPLMQIEDLVEKDWSFLDTDYPSSDEEHRLKMDRIISAGGISKTARVLVSIGSEAFVDRVFDTSPVQQLLIVHDSLLTLACIKEKYDSVKCWQGEVINVPEKWTPFDVVFLYFLPGLPFELNEVLGALAKRCSLGARVVMSHPQGRQAIEEQRLKYPDVVVSSLPEETMLVSVAAEHSFEVVEFVDEPAGFYLAVLRLNTVQDM